MAEPALNGAKASASEGKLAASPGSIVDAQAAQLSAYASDADWLAEVNRWRTEAGVEPIGENIALNAGAADHAEYLVKNGPGGADSFVRYAIAIDGPAHTEDRDNQFYTPEGDDAARLGDIGYECGQAKLVDGLIEAPFHRLMILAPWMRAGGYGDYGRRPVHAATLVIRGSTGVGLKQAVLFPPDNGTVDGIMRNSEWPILLRLVPDTPFRWAHR